MAGQDRERLVWAEDHQSGGWHVVDRGSYGVPAALALCGHRIDLREPRTTWAISITDGRQARCGKCVLVLAQPEG